MSPTADSAVAPGAPAAADEPARRDETATITLEGRLDANAGVELLAALQSHIAAGACRIDIDLLGVTDWAPEGARALRRGRRIARTLPDGLHYRTGHGAGHDALMAAFADSADDEVVDDGVEETEED